MNTSNLTWSSSILELSPTKKPAKSILKIKDAGIQTIKDLLWIFPLRIKPMPRITNFDQIQMNELFMGHCKVINIQFAPAFSRRGKGKVQLFNATVVVKDMLSDKYLNLKWFNTYPGLRKQLETLNDFVFMGEVQDYRGSLQIINPKINPNLDGNEKFIIEYPTLNTVPGKYTKTLISRIPNYLWDTPIRFYPEPIEKEFGLQSLNASFLTLHGRGESIESSKLDEAKKRIICDEFLIDQLKMSARKIKNNKLQAPKLSSNKLKLDEYKNLFPYQLTTDQEKSLDDIINDFTSGHPMMRMLQGDVGCGKTTVAIISALIAIENNGQVAFMCPTEALALQHAETVNKTLKEKISIALLLGSTKKKEKQDIYKRLQAGEIKFLIGTHSLFQDSVVFKNLKLAIIDEQHKFGVEQRQKLVAKGNGTHSLIMTATPIPRTLQLAQYGDLDISTIRTIPAHRKGIKTRIITDSTYEKYLSFIKTRVSLKEQVYVVVPAISESETLDLKNIDSHLVLYNKIFPDLKIEVLHGQLKPDEKQKVLERFNHGNIDILISTSVIEVGINVLNATVMAIYAPERFGLSSLHQLRGRVGRGEKPGFCFLITDKGTSKEGMNRLKIIEKNTDGFIIADADLKNRGEGDLFGVNQSGTVSNSKLASIFQHIDIFEEVSKKVQSISKNKPDLLLPLIDQLVQDTKISSTI